MFLRNITIFLENIKVFFAAWECVKTKPRPYEPKDSIGLSCNSWGINIC